MGHLLEVKNLSICYAGQTMAVKDASFTLEAGHVLSIVGESGSGKSTLVHGIMGLLSSGGEITEGEILFNGKNLRTLSAKMMQKIRGEEIAMIFQDAGLAMDPIRTVGNQFVEYILTHQSIPEGKARELAVEWLRRMNLQEPQRVMDSYPFELSGGMKQRVAIAMSMVQNPRLLLADEPTSALDVTVQAQVVYELQRLTEEFGTAIIMVTHNMGVASYLSDDICVMKLGEVVEYGPRDQIVFHPQNDYTRMLLDTVPKLRYAANTDDAAQDGAPVAHAAEANAAGINDTHKPDGTGGTDTVNAPAEDGQKALLEIRGVRKVFKGHRGEEVAAVDGVDFSLYEGECLGVVGESGCGKSTTARMIIGTYPPTEGEVDLQDMCFCQMRRKGQREYRRHVQIVFQNPISSFSPRMTIGDYLYEPLRNYEKLSRAKARERIAIYMEAVGLPLEFLKRLPHELSGGQLQRVVIARAALIQPDLIICDEATSALDVSIQKQVVDMLVKLQKKWHLSYLFIGHDLALVQYISQRIVVMYLGQIVELLDSARLIEEAVHPYTQILLDAVFDVYEDRSERRKLLERNKVEPLGEANGCKFAPRCRFCMPQCLQKRPALVKVGKRHYAACHRCTAE